MEVTNYVYALKTAWWIVEIPIFFPSKMDHRAAQSFNNSTNNYRLTTYLCFPAGAPWSDGFPVGFPGPDWNEADVVQPGSMSQSPPGTVKKRQQNLPMNNWNVSTSLPHTRFHSVHCFLSNRCLCFIELVSMQGSSTWKHLKKKKFIFMLSTSCNNLPASWHPLACWGMLSVRLTSLQRCHGSEAFPLMIWHLPGPSPRYSSCLRKHNDRH